MKTIQLTVAMLTAAWLLNTAPVAVAQHTNPDSPVTVAALKSGGKRIRLVTPANAAVDVAVIDEQGTILHQSTIQANDKRGVLLNLQNLPDGRYYLTATNNDFWVSQSVTVRNQQAIVDARNVTELVRPALTVYAKNKVEVAMPGVEKLTVSIYNRTNDLVFTQSFGSGNRHRFDLSSLPGGQYTFVYGPEQKQFTERIAINQ
ncbi:T9SS C-terminal target domain-containing protein [Fibrella sp. HMF5335]|uniref:T9SS C-terminal target domain-containing protein n=1 Tax=Fibrella rubiginis TaxID=2817060 RepID=A0A939GFH5_9BACT|nr:T9SS C-terminal target domain-containing protein [Fibrella rubiginis]MBO0936838.1 T9SS C-terminal target domain-containing protein [Fibrella rubiginis]